MQSPALLIAALLSVMGSGCQSFRELAQCNSVTSTINSTLERAKAVHTQEPTAERYREIVTLLGELEVKLTDSKITNPELAQVTSDYVKQLHRSTRDADSYAQMLQQLEKARKDADTAHVTEAEAELERIRQRASRNLDGAKPLAKKFKDTCRK